jgi:hypothetical protein
VVEGELGTHPGMKSSGNNGSNAPVEPFVFVLRRHIGAYVSLSDVAPSALRSRSGGELIAQC